MARTASLVLFVVCTGCGPAVTVPEEEEEGGDGGSTSASSTSAEVDADSIASTGGGMLPPCEPWTLDVLIDAREGEAITDIDFRENRLVVGGLVTTSTLVRLDDVYEPTTQIDVEAGARIWDVFADSGQNGPIIVAGTSSNPSAFFFAYVDNLGNLNHLAHYHAALDSPWEPVRLFRDATMAGYVISGHTGDLGAPSLSTIRVDYDGSVLWTFDLELTLGSVVGEPLSKGAADLWEQGDLVQLTADGTSLRIIRTALVGEIIWDRTLDIEASPIDVRALEGDEILVLARSAAGAHLLRLDGEANVLWERSYNEGLESNPSALAISATGEAALVAGGTRAEGGEPRTWIFVVDGSGEPLFTHVGDPGTPSTFHRAVYDYRFLVTATDRPWVAQVVAHPC